MTLPTTKVPGPSPANMQRSPAASANELATDVAATESCDYCGGSGVIRTERDPDGSGGGCSPCSRCRPSFQPESVRPSVGQRPEPDRTQAQVAAAETPSSNATASERNGAHPYADSNCDICGRHGPTNIITSGHRLGQGLCLACTHKHAAGCGYAPCMGDVNTPDPDAKAAQDELDIARQLDGEEAEREAREEPERFDETTGPMEDGRSDPSLGDPFDAAIAGIRRAAAGIQFSIDRAKKHLDRADAILAKYRGGAQ